VKPSNRSSVPDIACEILDLWWCNEERDIRFEHVTYILHAIGAACASELVPELLKRSRSENARTRELAVEALGRIGPVAATKDTLLRLTECLRNPKEDVRWKAAEALGRLGGAAVAPEVVALLSECLGERNNSALTSSAARALFQMGDVVLTPEVQRRLYAHCYSDEDDTHEQPHFSALVHDQPTPEAMAHVADSILNPPWERRVPGCRREPTYRLCVEDQIEWLRKSDVFARSIAMENLACRGGAAATPELLARLIQLLRDPESVVRSLAAEALGRFLATGIRWVQDKDGHLRVTNVNELSGEKM
jgi:hypothetical protein